MLFFPNRETKRKTRKKGIKTNETEIQTNVVALDDFASNGVVDDAKKDASRKKKKAVKTTSPSGMPNVANVKK